MIGNYVELGRELGLGLRPNSELILGLESRPNSNPTRHRPAQRLGVELGRAIIFTLETQLDMKPGANRKCRVGFELGLAIKNALRAFLIARPGSTQFWPSSIAPGFVSNWGGKVQIIDLPVRFGFYSPIYVELEASLANIAPTHLARLGNSIGPIWPAELASISTKPSNQISLLFVRIK